MSAEAVNIKTSLSFEPRPWSTRSCDAYGVPRLFEYSTYTRVLDSSSYRPVYDWCLAVEHMRIAQAYQACMAVYKITRLPCELGNLTVDGFIFTRPRKSSTAEKIKEIVESLTVGRLPRLEDIVRDRLHQPKPKQKRLKTTDLFPISGRVSDAPVFRVVTPQARQHLRGTYDVKTVTRDHPVGYSPRCWCDLDADAAARHVQAGGSI
jgi:hypothetical protein